MQPDPILPGDCPPSESSSAHGEVFRCCKGNPPTSADMVTSEESGRLADADPCLRRALSVFRDEQDAIHQVMLFRRWKRKSVAKATLQESHGRTMPTSGQLPSHTSWWPAPGLGATERAAVFQVVHEVQA